MLSLYDALHQQPSRIIPSRITKRPVLFLLWSQFVITRFVTDHEFSNSATTSVSYPTSPAQHTVQHEHPLAKTTPVSSRHAQIGEGVGQRHLNAWEVKHHPLLPESEWSIRMNKTLTMI
jgi:hypothetical protein